jgi:hypothetical protein
VAALLAEAVADELVVVEQGEAARAAVGIGVEEPARRQG